MAMRATPSSTPLWIFMPTRKLTFPAIAKMLMLAVIITSAMT